MAHHRRRVAFQALTGRQPHLQLHQVKPRRRFGDGVLDLEPRVHLHEHELRRGVVVEELDRAGVGVPDGLRQPSGGGADLGILLARQRRRWSFLDQLLVPPLHRAVPHPHGPDATVVVGDYLDLDVAGRGQQLLDEHRVVAEGLPGLGLGRPDRPVEILGHVDPPDAAPAPTRRRLDHHGVAEPGGLAVGGLDRAHRSTAPRCDGDADGVGDALGGDLVPGAAHGFGGRADEADAEAFAKLCERGLLGDETPAHPGGVSLRCAAAPAPAGRGRGTSS